MILSLLKARKNEIEEVARRSVFERDVSFPVR